MSEEKLSWIKLMYKNSYLQVFIAAFIFFVTELIFRDDFYSETGFYVGISIPIGIMMLIIYFGFYKFWKEYSSEK